MSSTCREPKPNRHFSRYLSRELAQKYTCETKVCPTISNFCIPEEGVHFYNRCIGQATTDVPLLRVQEKELGRLHAVFEPCSNQRELVLTKTSFASGQEPNVKTIVVPANTSEVDLSNVLYYFMMYRDTYTSLTVSAPNDFFLVSTFKRLVEHPWTTEEKHDFAVAFDRLIHDTAEDLHLEVDEAVLQTNLTRLEAQKTITSLDTINIEDSALKFPGSGAGISNWFNWAKANATDIPKSAKDKFPNPALSFVSSLYTNQAAMRASFAQDVAYNGTITLQQRDSDALCGFTLTSFGEPVCTTGKPITLSIGQNGYKIDVVNGNFEFDTPYIYGLSPFHFNINIRLDLGKGGLPSDYTSLKVTSQNLSFCSRVHRWIEENRCIRTIFPQFLQGKPLVLRDGLVCVFDTLSKAEQFVKSADEIEEQKKNIIPVLVKKMTE